MSVEEEKVETASCGVLDEAFDFMKKAHELINQQALDVRKEKEAFDSVAQNLEHVHFASTIKLNVGGQYFTTSLQTLTKDKGSMLHAMFSGRFDTKPAEDGSYFIDRDGTHFRHILNFLRTGYLLAPNDKLIRKEILEEAEFYQIRGIVDELRPPPFQGSELLSAGQKQIFVNNWLKDRLGRRHSTFVLLYRASRDGWDSSTFHAICDYQGPTVTVVKSEDYIFGGYTEKLWDADSGYKHCKESFLFSLVNQYGDKPTKLPLMSGRHKYGIYCDSSFGPTFGEGHDLKICDDANETSNSCSKLDDTYECPPHVTNTTFLSGESDFTVDEVEVFVFQE